MTVANFIIAGTEKAGTTSVFSYLSQHPQVAASRRKETDFFRSSNGTLADYAAHFPDTRGRSVVMEASPGYLGEAEQVVPRMRAMIPDVKLLFILRDPVDRFLSSYHFHRAKLNLPRDLTLRRYIEACLEYAAAGAADRSAVVRATGIDDWFLKVLPFGCYAMHLRRYLAAFARESILVAFYDDLHVQPRAFMAEVSAFLRIDDGFWDSAEFKAVNVTFSGRSRGLHRLAVRANEALEPWLRPRPRLKSAVVATYKLLNGAGEGYEGMSEGDRARLESYYAPHNAALEKLLGRHLPAGWRVEADGALPAGDLESRGVMAP